jgi:hypothetical protein
VRIDRDVFLILAAALSACHAPSPPAPATATVAKKAADPGALCAELAAANQTEAARATGTCTDQKDTPFYVMGDVPTAHASLEQAARDGTFSCRATLQGAWGIQIFGASISSPSVEGGLRCGWEVGARLIYQPTTGARTELPLGPIGDFYGHGFAHVEAVADLDGDGVPEAILESFRGSFGSCEGRPKLRVLSAKGGQIVDYPIPFPFDAWIDADGDGRPDLVDQSYFSYVNYGLCGDDRSTSVPILLHARADGTFSRDDQVARAWARTQCPERPADPGSDVACARVWGATREEVEAQLPPVPDSPDTSMVVQIQAQHDLAAVDPPFPPLSKDTPAPLARKKGL